jgi:hypothetical protein
MGLRYVDGVLRKKRGMLYWVILCPYCGRNHWCAIGPYTADPDNHRFVKLPCGSKVEVRRPKAEGGR